MQTPAKKFTATEGASTYSPQYKTLADKITEYILQSQLKPGDRLPTEQGLSEQFGVSRSIVHDAIKYLSATGLVGVRKGVGIYVTDRPHTGPQTAIQLTMPIDPFHMIALFDYRAAIETITARLAAQHITVGELHELERHLAVNRQGAEAGQWEIFLESDGAFHRAIAVATHNPFFAETVDSILQLQRWAIRLVMGSFPGSMVIAVEEHEAVFAGLESGDPDTAAQAMKGHIETASLNYQREVQQRLVSQEQL